MIIHWVQWNSSSYEVHASIVTSKTTQKHCCSWEVSLLSCDSTKKTHRLSNARVYTKWKWISARTRTLLCDNCYEKFTHTFILGFTRIRSINNINNVLGPYWNHDKKEIPPYINDTSSLIKLVSLLSSIQVLREPLTVLLIDLLSKGTINLSRNVHYEEMFNIISQLLFITERKKPIN